jgi:hypothetical protein
MSDTNQLQAIGQQLTSVLVNAYSVNTPGSNLAFLPGGLAVPDDIVQSGIVNPTQLQQWLATNFDFPFVVSTAEAAVLQREFTQAASFIYGVAVTQAQPVGNPSDDAWKRVDAEIAMAQSSFGPPDAPKFLACEPDNWLLPSADGYWTKFDSSETTSTSETTTTPVPTVNSKLWMLRSLADAPVVSSPPPDVATAPPKFVISKPIMFASPAVATFSPAVLQRSVLLRDAAVTSVAPIAFAAGAVQSSSPSPAASPAPQALAVADVARWRVAAGAGQLPELMSAEALFSTAPVVSQITSSTSSSSTITVHLEHQLVTIARYAAGQSWWNGVFLADQGWYIPGLQKGGLLPPADGADTGASKGLPVAIVVIRNLRIAGQWSDEAVSTFNTGGGTIGPLTVFNATSSTNTDGTITFSHDGMQVVALMCSPLPVLPPVDTPAASTGPEGS